MDYHNEWNPSENEEKTTDEDCRTLTTKEKKSFYKPKENHNKFQKPMTVAAARKQAVRVGAGTETE